MMTHYPTTRSFPRINKHFVLMNTYEHYYHAWTWPSISKIDEQTWTLLTRMTFTLHQQNWRNIYEHIHAIYIHTYIVLPLHTHTVTHDPLHMNRSSFERAGKVFSHKNVQKAFQTAVFRVQKRFYINIHSCWKISRNLYLERAFSIYFYPCYIKMESRGNIGLPHVKKTEKYETLCLPFY